jgi:hypothetical protein
VVLLLRLIRLAENVDNFILPITNPAIFVVWAAFLVRARIIHHAFRPRTLVCFKLLERGQMRLEVMGGTGAIDSPQTTAMFCTERFGHSRPQDSIFFEDGRTHGLPWCGGRNQPPKNALSKKWHGGRGK